MRKSGIITKLGLGLLLCFSVAGSVMALAENATRAQTLDNFRQSQKCYHSANQAQDYAQALGCAQTSLALGLELFEPNHKNIAALNHNYGLMLGLNNDNESSIKQLEETLELYQQIYGPQSENVAWLLLDLADTELKTRSNTAARTYKKALTILSSEENYQPLNYAEIALTTSIALSGIGLDVWSLNYSIEVATQAYKIYSEQLEPGHKVTSLAAFTLGKLKYLKKDHSAAIPLFQEATTNGETAPYAHGFLAEIYDKKGETDLAAFHRQAIVESRLSDDRSYLPIFVPSPKYPKRAVSRGKEGYAIVKITVTATGAVSEPVLVKESPEKWGFGKAALKVAHKLRYAPKIVNGEAQEVPGVLYKFSFETAK